MIVGVQGGNSLGSYPGTTLQTSLHSPLIDPPEKITHLASTIGSHVIAAVEGVGNFQKPLEQDDQQTEMGRVTIGANGS